jgi:cytochrome oxidase assembly protein ShyY1
MYRFLARPKWIGFSLLVIAVMATCVAAARWQWDRYQFKVDRRDAVAAALRAQPLAISTATDLPTTQWTMVTLTGEFSSDEQIVIRNRSQGGQSGVHVVAPLVLADGSAVFINRGFLGASSADDAVAPAPPSGPVTITGPVRPSQQRSGLEVADPSDGRLTIMNRVDIERIARQTPRTLARGYVEADQAPAGLVAVDLPTGDLGPHLSYTGQWILFALLAAVGWVVVVRRSARTATVAHDGVVEAHDRLDP